MENARGQWGSRLGFILAAAGSAVGLGNIWKFPYITGENGGGVFVLVYLACIVLVGLPILVAEVALGRSTGTSPVGAFRKLSAPGSPWMAVGWLGVAAAFVILSYYSVVAGWAMHYVYLSATETFVGQDAKAIGDTFGALYGDGQLNLLWHVIFMGLTMAIVVGGVKKGVERASRILMPALGLMMLYLLYTAMQGDGFSKAMDFVFGANTEKFKGGESVLEALGHSFFTLSLGMGAMLTYGSYLSRKEDLVASSGLIAFFDTAIALLACMVLFPITFTHGMDPTAGPGLVFINIPIAFSQTTGGTALSILFFLLLTFAALTSAISLLEVAAAYFIDEKKWSRAKATLVCGLTILVFGVPSALSGGDGAFGKGFAEITSALFGEGKGKNWFDFFDYLASNWMLPLGGLGIALFMAWRVGPKAREEAVITGSRFGKLFYSWVFLLRYLVPVGVIAVFLHSVGVI